jgi:hypothetical protein
MALVLSAGPSSASVHVAPRQHFEALVNGSPGSPNPVVIRMGCFGAIRPGQTGHPMSGQTITVKQALGSGSAFGYTGSSANSIRAFFGPPPSSGSGTTSDSVTFSHYVTKALPTTLVLPCAGSGTVTFVPLPMSSTARDASVPVYFEGQP